tara:strand:+ start:1190 stop:1603 length:414 start_codon:yes stop_codon:yes gene_type:complete
MNEYIATETQIEMIAEWFFDNSKPYEREVFNLITDHEIMFNTSFELADALGKANFGGLAFYSESEKGSDHPVISDAASVWNLCCNLEYQAMQAEEDDWPSTDTYWIIKGIKDHAAEKGMRTDLADITWGGKPILQAS